ncbi:MAG: hypothetical protein KAI86_10225 [Desulfobacterales bacterium]|nr:hypothetical protein [Desulfobacterales bacterium]
MWFDNSEPHLGLYLTQRMMTEHAQKYISDATNDANIMERRGKVRTSHWDRKGFLRKATKAYRLAFA